MTRTAKAAPVLSVAQKLDALDSELAKVTENFRLAKLAAKEAKAEAKIVKKEMKRVRKAWKAAYDEQQEEAAASAKRKKAKAPSSSPARAKPKDATALDPKRKVADSPEAIRKPRRKKNPAVVSTAVSPTEAVAPAVTAAEPELPREIPDATVSPEKENGPTVG